MIIIIFFLEFFLTAYYSVQIYAVFMQGW